MRVRVQEALIFELDLGGLPFRLANRTASARGWKVAGRLHGIKPMHLGNP